MKECDYKRYDCYTFKEFECCISCHYEWDDGYSDPMEWFYRDLKIHTIGCCNFDEWIVEKLNIKESSSVFP